jgi:putative oxidoreductase
MLDSAKFQNTALLLARLITAVIFLYAAYAKFGLWSYVPEGGGPVDAMTNLMKFLSIVEPIGALALIVGFLTRWASLGLAIIMLGAIYVMQFMMGIGFATATGAGWNFPLVVLATCLLLMAFGAGKWSVDAVMCKKM